ncbi:unnamed protein product [Closterium sp. Naga37s-1]|nr:unnamed protein product [Closterium sp. Naga37s-1]
MEPPTHIHGLPDDILIKIFWHTEQPIPRQTGSDCLWDSDSSIPAPKYLSANLSNENAIRQEKKTPLPIPPPSADAHRILLVAAVCCRWRCLTQRSVSALLVRDNLVVSRQALASAVAALPNLTHLHLCDGSVETLDDAFLAHLASSCPNLAILHVGTRIAPVKCKGYYGRICEKDALPITTAGLDLFFRHCTRLEQLSLYCLDRCVRFPASFFQLPHLHTLALTHASSLETLGFASLTSLTTLHIASKNVLDEVANIVRRSRITTFSDSDEAVAFHRDSLVSADFNMAQLPLLKPSSVVFADFDTTQLGLLKSSRLRKAVPCAALERLEIVMERPRSVTPTFQLAELMPRLRKLTIRQSLEYDDPRPIALSFASLTLLESLTFTECYQRDIFWGYYDLPEGIGCLLALRTLVLHNLPLMALPDALCHLPSLETFVLIGSISSPQALQLPADFCCLTSLQTLAIVKMPRTGPPASLPLSLEVLSLGNSYHVADLPDVSVLPWLRKLSLKLVGAEERMAVGSSLARVKQVELALQEEAVELPFSLALLPQLHTLVMWNAGKMQRLPSDMGWAVPQLRVLQIHCARELRELPDSIGAASRLRQLHLFDCPALHHLPASLTQLSCLHQLHVENTGLRSLPSGISQLTRLRSLSLHGCLRLQGLPEGLTELKMLQYLGIKNCSAKHVRGEWNYECNHWDVKPYGLRSMYGLKIDA